MSILEVVTALLLGLTLLWLVFEPMLSTTWRPPPPEADLPELESTPHGAALIALKDLELDYATGKLSDADYQELKTRYTVAAVVLLRETDSTPGSTATPAAALAVAPDRSLACPGCGPRPENDAIFCSACGRKLA
jgi:hypothetical protein